MDKHFTSEEKKILIFIVVIIITGSLIEYISFPLLPEIKPEESESNRPVSDEIDSGAVSHPVSRVDINSANAEQLIALPGIGPSIAGRIINTRIETGGFSSVEDLLKVKGIGEKKLTKLKPLVTCGSFEDNR